MASAAPDLRARTDRLFWRKMIMKFRLLLKAIAPLLTVVATVSAAPTATAQARPTAETASPRNATPAEFARLAAEADTVILDVRTAGEFKAGRLKGAININYHGVDFAERLAALDKSKTYLVHCASGVRSLKACQKMSQMGFAKLVNLAGGLQSWSRAGLPLEK